MSNVAHLPIVADRYGACVRQIYVEGFDLSGVTMRAQIRLGGDVPGAPLVDLLTVTNGNAEGLRLVEVETTAGVPVSHVELVINESTLEGLPYIGEIGDATSLAWDWQITLAGRKQRIARGAFMITGDGVTGADAAPANRSSGWSSGRALADGMRTGATLTFGDDVTRVSIDGAALAFVASGRAEKAMGAAELAAASATAAGRYFPTRLAGETGSSTGQLFSTDDGAGNVIYYRRVDAGSIEVGRALTPAAMQGPSGSSRVGFRQDADDAVDETVQTVLRQRVSVKSFGAIGDGVTNDRAAVLKAYRHAVLKKKSLYFPAGVYRCWLVIEDEGVVIEGDGSARTILKLPDGAQHTIPDNNAGSGPTATGTPCVLDFGMIGHGNDATPRVGAHLSGLTLDGNRAATAAPALDLFGWGLAFTAYSSVTYDDIVVVNCHAGGIGTFINSNYHRGSNWQVSRSGYTLGHPGFDVNSSKYSVWSGVVDSCREGARMLDNCRNNALDVSIASCDRTGFIYGNQIAPNAPGTGNFCENNDIAVRVDGGCSVAGVQIGAKCASGTLSATIANVQGVGIQESRQAAAGDNPRGINYRVTTIRGGRGSCIIGGDSGIWDIISIDDGQSVATGTTWAIDVFGDSNILSVAYQDTAGKLRGIQFNAGADGTRLLAYTHRGSVQPLADAGIGNSYRGFKEWNPLALSSGHGNAYGDGPVASYRYLDDGDVVGIGVVNGPAGDVMTVLPVRARPLMRCYFGGGTMPFTADPNGEIRGQGAGPWNLAAMRFQPA
jgi:hypothetical protein